MKKNNTSKKKERTLDEINDLLVKGDHKLIAIITGFVPDYISKVLDKRRNSAKVIEIANVVIENREELIKKYSK